MNIEQLKDKHIRADVTALVALVHEDFTSLNDSEDGMGSQFGFKTERLSAPFLDYEAAARAAGWKEGTGSGWICLNDNEAFASNPKDACESYGIAPQEIPIIGHYIVTSELADKLEARGERVERDFGGVIVWARKLTPKAVCNRSIWNEAVDDWILPLDRDPVLLAIIEAEGR